MVQLRSSSKISGTDSSPTGSRYVTSTPDEGVDVCSPCSVSKTYTRSKRKATIEDNLLRKKKKEEEKEEEESDEKNEEEDSKDVSEVESSKEEDEEKVDEKDSVEEESAGLKVGEYIIPVKDWRYLQVNPIGVSTKVLGQILPCLETEQEKLFREYSVGHLLDLNEKHISYWPGLIHSTLIHQVYYPLNGELALNFGGTKLRLGCAEFCILSGLPYIGTDDFSGCSNRLLKKYGKEGKLKRSELFDAFVLCKDKSDQVKLGVAYLVEGLLFAKAASNLIRPEILGIVDDIAAFNKVAWGKLSWDYMVPKLKESMLNKRGNFKGTYAVKGFYDVISVFTMESIPELIKVGVERIGNKFPRILNWSMGVKCSYGQLAATVFKHPMTPRQIELTVEEAKHPNMVGVPKGNERNITVERDEVKDYPPTCIKEIKGTLKSVIERIDALEKDITSIRNMLTRFIVAQNEEMKDVKEQIGHLFEICRSFCTQGMQPPLTPEASENAGERISLCRSCVSQETTSKFR